MPVFTFDAVEHRYFLDGIHIPGVTSILKSAGLVPNYGGFGEAQLRGLHVHYACELLDLNDLDWSSVYPKWMGYVRAYEKFKEESGFISELIEYQSYHPTLRYAGTLDRRGKMNGWNWVIDLKTYASSDWWQLQTKGYKLLNREFDQDKRAALQLNENGTYKLHVHEDEEGDMSAFISALALYHWKNNRGIKQ